MIIKPAEETPGSFLGVARSLAEAGLPDGVLNVVYGRPADVSHHLIASPVVRKIAFTGSTRVGKGLAALAGAHAKPLVMELGGHAPVLVFEDASRRLRYCRHSRAAPLVRLAVDARPIRRDGAVDRG